MLFEATGRGFAMVPFEKWRKRNRLVRQYSLSVSPGAQFTALRAVADLLGTEYDTMSLLGYMLRRWKVRFHNPLSSPTKVVCSEVVAMFLKHLNLVQGDPASYLPKDIDTVAKTGSPFVLVGQMIES